ncbi:MAG TPA: tetratricopeptide repeat protein [Myxococcota bacterium]|nr:tetratricopeptide repeat protein [Myxococcota bacterium]
MGSSKLLRVLSGLALAFCLASTPVFAQSKKEDEEKKPTNTIDQQTGKKLQAAYDAYQANPPKLNEAKGVLDTLDQKKLSPYEMSRVQQLYAVIAQQQERYADARRHLQLMLDSGGLNEQEILDGKFNIAQLYLAQEQWREGAAALEAWIAASPKPNSNAYYLLAVAYYQQGDERRALPPAEKALALSEKPQPSWLQLVLALYLKNEQYAKAEPLVRKLVATQPNNKANWVQLSAVLGAQEKYDDALVALQLAYHMGLLTDSTDLTRLADLMAYNSIPYRCGMLLTKEAPRLEKSGAVQEKLSNCWVAAREWDKAVAPLRAAAQAKRSGDLYLRLGEVHVQREDWNAAIEALRRALEAGNAKDPGNAQILLGMAYYNLKKPQEARQWFQRAMSSRHAKQAEGWIRAIDVETGKS